MVSYCAVLFLVVVTIISAAHCSTIGVEYVSRLLEIQDRERAPAAVQVAAARGVLERLLPSHSASFEFRIVSKEECGGTLCFMIQNHPGFSGPGTPEIMISGSTGVEIAAGLHRYLKDLCNAHISWDKTGGTQLLSVPKAGELPRLEEGGILIRRPVPWNYYQNAVTSSYTFAWWDWKRWEKEIDWMALQGINLPLAFTGQEAIWQKVFQKLNISTSDLNDFFGGPAFLAWSRMGNLHGWGGPLPQSWLDQQLDLQKKILARMHELGMTPVLPAFSGNVPAALKNIFPSAKITRLGNWFTVQSDLRWCCTYLLDAKDPLFVKIGKSFIEQQLEEYGRTGHIYNCDTFDENTPPDDNPNFISSLGASIFEGMKSGDKDAIWLMQGWLFSYDPFWQPPQMKALLHSVPIGRLVVLDLFAEGRPIWRTSEQFYGVPYIWCMLHNFAGNIEMYGILDAVSAGPVDARTSKNSTMVGVGMSMEGIEQNPLVYDLMSEMAFRHEKIDVKTWVDQYSVRRYGKRVPLIQDAWQILYHTLYNCTDGSYDKNRDVIVAFPDVDPTTILSHLVMPVRRDTPSKSRRAILEYGADSFDRPHLWYSNDEVIHALELFITGTDELSESKTFSYDVVDLTRQALAKYANQLFLEVIEAYESQDIHKVTHLSQRFVNLVYEMDMLLSCHDGFLLGPWLESSKQLAVNEQQKMQYEWNARTQITMWFDNTEEEASLLRDYGNKYWSGLLRDYYGPRATIYFKYLIESLSTGNNFRLTDWRREWIKLTNDWQSGRNLYSIKSFGSSLNTSRWLYEKYLRNPDLSNYVSK
ncbi:unnamed protein product [Rhodiola kirilowii]